MLHGVVDQGDEPVRIEIDIGQGGKNGFAGEGVDGRVTDTDLGPGDRHLGNPLGRINEKVLKGCHIGLLAAYADLGASFAFGRLLALKTKHGDSSLDCGYFDYCYRCRYCFVVVVAESCSTRLIVFYPFRFELPLTWVNILILFFLMHMRCRRDNPTINDDGQYTLTYIKNPSKIITLNRDSECMSRRLRRA